MQSRTRRIRPDTRPIRRSIQEQQVGVTIALEPRIPVSAGIVEHERTAVEGDIAGGGERRERRGAHHSDVPRGRQVHHRPERDEVRAVPRHHRHAPCGHHHACRRAHADDLDPEAPSGAVDDDVDLAGRRSRDGTLRRPGARAVEDHLPRLIRHPVGCRQDDIGICAESRRPSNRRIDQVDHPVADGGAPAGIAQARVGEAEVGGIAGRHGDLKRSAAGRWRPWPQVAGW